MCLRRILHRTGGCKKRDASIDMNECPVAQPVDTIGWYVALLLAYFALNNPDERWWTLTSKN